MIEVSSACRNERADERGDIKKKFSRRSRRTIVLRSSIAVRATLPGSNMSGDKSSGQIRSNTASTLGPDNRSMTQLSD